MIARMGHQWRPHFLKKESLMSPTDNSNGRKAAWRHYLEWLCNATVEELEQLDHTLRHLPGRMSLMQAIEHALAHDWSSQTMPASLLQQYHCARSGSLLAAA